MNPKIFFERNRQLCGLGIGLIILALAALLLLTGCPPKPPNPPVMVTVKVCAETSLLPNEYCPVVIEKQYKKGTEPTTACAVHRAPIALAFEPGVDILDLLVAEGDWRAGLKALKDAGAQRVRFIADCQWKWTGTRPYEYAAYDEATAERIRYKDPRDPKRIENDGGTMVLVRESGLRFPLFDYTLPRAEYWTHLREVLDYCAEIKLGVYVDILDYCTLKQAGDPKYFSPWICAVQRMLPGVQNGTWGEQMKPWIAAFYQAVIIQAQQSGVDYIVSDMNEGDALGQSDEFMLAWFQWSNTIIKSLGVPQEKIATSAGRNTAAIGALCGFVCVHGVGTAAKIQTGGYRVERLAWSSDGYSGGSGGCDAHGKCGVGEQAAREIGAAIRTIGGKRYSILPRELYSQNNDRANLALMNTGPIKALYDEAIK